MKCFNSVDFTHSNTYKLFSLKKKWVSENTFLSVLLCNCARNQNATEHQRIVTHTETSLTVT